MYTGNLAMNKSTSQSGSTALTSDLAVNGRITDNPDDCALVDATVDATFRAWWSVDLGDIFTVTKVTIFNIEDKKDETFHSNANFCTF